MSQTTRTANLPLPTASANQVLTGVELAQAVAWLRGQAGALDALKLPTLSPQELSALNQQQAQLLARATALISLRILWTAGEARLEAQHIDDALAYASAVIDRVARLRGRLDALTAVLNFTGVLLAGDPVAIVKAGVTLRRDLDAVN